MKATDFTWPLTFAIIFMVGLWTVDVSTSCMVNESSIEGGCYMINVFNVPVEEEIVYHIGLIMSLMSFAASMFWMLFKIERLEA